MFQRLMSSQLILDQAIFIYTKTNSSLIWSIVCLGTIIVSLKVEFSNRTYQPGCCQEIALKGLQYSPANPSKDH